MSTHSSVREQIGWGPKPATFETSLVRKCEDALDLRLDQQTPETLRLLISQGLALELLMPLALSLMEQDILVSCGLYEGDLLASCKRVPAAHWLAFPDQWVELNSMLEDFDSIVEEVNKDRSTFLVNNPFGARL